MIFNLVFSEEADIRVGLSLRLRPELYDLTFPVSSLNLKMSDRLRQTVSGTNFIGVLTSTFSFHFPPSVSAVGPLVSTGASGCCDHRSSFSVRGAMFIRPSSVWRVRPARAAPSPAGRMCRPARLPWSRSRAACVNSGLPLALTRPFELTPRRRAAERLTTWCRTSGRRNRDRSNACGKSTGACESTSACERESTRL